jgi:hypothetical protein
MTTSRWFALVPDEPRFVEARGLVLAGAPVVPVGPDAALVLALDETLAVLIGAAEPGILRDAVLASRADTLLAQENMQRVAGAALPGWRCERATLHTLAPGAIASWPCDPPHVRCLPAGAVVSADDAVARRSQPGAALLEHVPQALRVELTKASASVPLFCAEDDGLLVSFAYGAYGTESLVDVSIETLAPWRRRGLAADAVRALIGWIVESGRQPVWGALDANVASMRLARRLGFEPCATLWVLSRERPIDPTAGSMTTP